MMRIAATLLLSMLVSCAGSSKYMVLDETPDPAVAPADQAMIVFVRPSGMSHGQSFTVLDGEGVFVGQIPAKGHVKHLAVPGHHRYFIWAENTAVMEADVVGGKTYYVEVPTRMGWWSGRSHLFPVKREGEHWEEVLEWVAETNEWDADPVATQEWLEAKAEGAQERLTLAEQEWNEYDAEEKERRTMRVEDGR